MSSRKVKSSARQFGHKLRMLRMHNNLTLQQFAESLGYSAHGYISELECGKKTPTVEFVLTVARVYKVTTDELLLDERKLPLGSSATR